MINTDVSRGKDADDATVLQAIAEAVNETSVPEKTFLDGLFTVAIITALIFLCLV